MKLTIALLGLLLLVLALWPQETPRGATGCVTPAVGRLDGKVMCLGAP